MLKGEEQQRKCVWQWTGSWWSLSVLHPLTWILALVVILQTAQRHYTFYFPFLYLKNLIYVSCLFLSNSKKLLTVLKSQNKKDLYAWRFARLLLLYNWSHCVNVESLRTAPCRRQSTMLSEQLNPSVCSTKCNNTKVLERCGCVFAPSSWSEQEEKWVEII